MSSSQGFSGRRYSGKAPEKSSFAQTCNRLSQFLKEKGNPRDLRLEIAGKLWPKGIPETSQITTASRNIFPTMKKSSDTLKQELMDLFPQHAGISCPSNMELDATCNPTTSKPATTVEAEPKTAQLTIFYEGNVFVFDNFPADKVGELMLLGSSSNENCPISSGLLSTPTAENDVQSSDSHLVASPGPSSDIPIARRSSLHRFFDKRKDRVAVKAPYQVGQGSCGPSTSPKPKEPLDLNL